MGEPKIDQNNYDILLRSNLKL